MRISTQTTIEMDYDEFDNLVHEHFPARSNYEFLVENEMGADDVWTMDVTPLTDRDRKDIEEWARNDRKVYGVGTYQLCSALVSKGVFPAGRVVITTY
jgi:hypothetical protein